MPPAPLLWLVIFGIVISQISLLQFVLDRWWPHVGAMPHVLELTVIWGADGVSVGVQNNSLGILVSPTSVADLRAILGHSGAPEGRRLDQAFDFRRFQMNLGTTF